MGLFDKSARDRENQGAEILWRHKRIGELDPVSAERGAAAEIVIYKSNDIPL